MLFQWFYISRANAVSIADVQSMVRASRSHNAEHDITGLFVYSGDYFAQVIEGRDESVGPSIASIRSDVRHQILWERPLVAIGHRWFGDWSLGYIYTDVLDNCVRRIEDDRGLPSLDVLVPALLRDLVTNKRSRTAAATMVE